MKVVKAAEPKELNTIDEIIKARKEQNEKNNNSKKKKKGIKLY